MTDDEGKLIKMIRESADPEKVSRYMLNLFSDFLRISLPSQETASADPQECAS